MSADNGFTLPAQHLKLLVKLLGERGEAVFKTGIIFRAGGDGAIALKTVAVPQRQHAAADTGGQHGADEQIRV